MKKHAPVTETTPLNSAFNPDNLRERTRAGRAKKEERTKEETGSAIAVVDNEKQKLSATPIPNSSHGCKARRPIT